MGIQDPAAGVAGGSAGEALAPAILVAVPDAGQVPPVVRDRDRRRHGPVSVEARRAYLMGDAS